MISKNPALRLGRAFTIACGLGIPTIAYGKEKDGCRFYQAGIASWYKAGTETANGESFKPDGISAAHKNLPFGTIVLAVTPEGRKVRTRINDRGPFIGGRVIDFSRGAATRLGMIRSGTKRVELYICPR